MTVAEKLKSWLDEIGADGLMIIGDQQSVIATKDIREWAVITPDRVPAFRHADGRWHTEPKHWFLCKTCICDCMPIGDDACNARFDARECTPYQSWLAHKEEAK
jgi:hypothetical protein